MGCTTCSTACPDPVPVINRTEVTAPGFPIVTLSISETGTNTVTVSAQVTDDNDIQSIPWLIRFWFSDSSNVALLGKETLTPPETPGVSQFFKVTDAAGATNFTVYDTTGKTWFVNAAVIGHVATSDEVVLV